MADLNQCLADFAQGMILNITLNPRSKRTSRFDVSKGLVFDVFEMSEDPSYTIGDEFPMDFNTWKYERGYKHSREDLVYEATLYCKDAYGVDYKPVARLEMEYDKETDQRSREVFYFDKQPTDDHISICDMVFGLSMIYDRRLTIPVAVISTCVSCEEGVNNEDQALV